MSAELVIAVLSEAWHRFGPPQPHNEREIAQWCQARVAAIKSGQATETLAHPTLPRSFERSWYETEEREPGSDDA